jgi:regulatory protein
MPRLKDSRADTNRTAYITEARHYALRLFHYRPRSRKEIRNKLKTKGFTDKQINGVMQFLDNAGLLNDKILASELLRNAVKRRYLGKKGIAMFLFKRGIERELINETLLTHTREMENDAAHRLVEKKMRTMRNHPKNTVKRRLCGMLQRRGFSSDIIYNALKSIGNK